MTSWESMCTDLSVFKSVVSIPANTTVDPADLQTKICGVNLNYTKLFEVVVVTGCRKAQVSDCTSSTVYNLMVVLFSKIFSHQYKSELTDSINS
jgi:hypothetical protein